MDTCCMAVFHTWLAAALLQLTGWECCLVLSIQYSTPHELRGIVHTAQRTVPHDNNATTTVLPFFILLANVWFRYIRYGVSTNHSQQTLALYCIKSVNGKDGPDLNIKWSISTLTTCNLPLEFNTQVFDILLPNLNARLHINKRLQRIFHPTQAIC